MSLVWSAIVMNPLASIWAFIAYTDDDQSQLTDHGLFVCMINRCSRSAWNQHVSITEFGSISTNRKVSLPIAWKWVRDNAFWSTILLVFRSNEYFSHGACARHVIHTGKTLSPLAGWLKYCTYIRPNYVILYNLSSFRTPSPLDNAFYKPLATIMYYYFSIYDFRF